MNSRSSSVGKGYENEFSEFLIKGIANAGGSLQLQHITGHLSQVRNEVKNAVASSKPDLVHFLKRHDNLFSIENNVVSLVKSSSGTSGYESDSSTTSYSNLPLNIKNGRGVIIKIFSGYGFIKSKEPIKTEIYFNSLVYGDKDIDLTSFLHTGAIVFFHAKRKSSTNSSNCKYHAFKVWRNDNSDDASNVIIQKTRKNRETGLYDPLNLESEGVIQNIFPNLGFISVKGDDKNTVFFHKNRVANYDNIVDLTKVFSKGDRVEFTAHRSTKPDAKARWEAAKVWKVSGKIQEDKPLSGNSSLSLSKQPISKLRTKTPEMIKNKQGKILPRSHGALIKFDKDEIADGDSALYYVCETQVTEIGWEFTEGDDVYFDAVKIKSAPGWKAVLVWSGKKPDIVLPTCLGDFSEFTEEDDNGEIDSSIYTSKSSLYMSESSSSSLKSEKLSSKTKDSKKENAPKYGNFINKKIQGSYKNQSKNHKSSSRESLNSLSLSDKYSFYSEEGIHKKLSNNHSSSKDSLSSLTTSNKYNTLNLKYSEEIVKSKSDKSVDRINKMHSNWDDSPSPLNEIHESMEASKNFKSDNASKYYAEDEIENSSEYASAEEEKVDKNSEIENDEIASQNNNLKYTANVKRYCDIKGKINKVFYKFAEIKSSISPNTIPFCSNDFYSQGMTMDELDLDDLSKILKIGDDIYFNCFIINDDLGQNWQKVTLAWQGSKPGYPDEISPEDFIKQNDLSVTVINKNNDYNQTEEFNRKKYLTSFIDENTDDKNSEIVNDEISSQNNNLKYTANVKRYCDIKGKVHKVFYRFAEIKSSISPNTISVCSNDFYSQGMTMDQLDLDDLSKILKIGDDIYFNCFIIIDDLGQNWQKVTLAWQGSKPEYPDEISPEDFIKQNDLSVTVINKNNDYNQTEKFNRKNFLTPFIDENTDDNIDNLSRTESCSEEESSILSQKLENKIELSADSESLPDTVCKILESNVLSQTSMVDLKIVSEEIINIVLQNFLKKATCNVLPEGKYVSDSLENVCSKCKGRTADSESVKTKESASQTIITGEIISHNILPGC